MRRTADNRSNITHTAAISTWPALFEFLRLRFNTITTLPDTAHEIYKADSAVEYPYATVNSQSYPAGENADKTPNNCI